MPEFCPKCGNMVADGTERCPACGSRMRPRVMDEESGFTWVDFFNYSAVTILIILAAILIPVAIGLLCFGLYWLLAAFPLAASVLGGLRGIA